ncbi:MAG: hypothetical protein E3K37_03600 [Candidatus Kuenenia sp.]|nr:hypothetical protein [Candidatus Kuenenia hertensis]
MALPAGKKYFRKKFLYIELRLTERYKDRNMSGVKEKMTGVIRSQPKDAAYEEKMRELVFERMVKRGL